ncbi:hypothetical protein SLS53_008874 [Cytospora paraplurivora]|uniref:Uncharacterized protein n=1 Tax=Cytospora paraplurivora TaxID=2898453 RepID=A0AAN9YCN2_9PEZI
MTQAKTDAAAEKIFGSSVVSKFTTPADLEKYGWQEDKGHVIALFEVAQEDVYKNLKISENDDKAIRHDNDKEVTVGGKTYAKTSGHYNSLINVPGGLLVADDNKSPAETDTKKDAITPLRHWSDVAFLQWTKVAGQKTKSLKHIIQSSISNAQTKTRIQEALKKTGYKKTPTWAKAATFTMTEEAGLALLGSPNGAGCGFLLIGHKKQLGVKKITKVTVWSENEWDLSQDVNDKSKFSSLELYMMFDIADA